MTQAQQKQQLNNRLDKCRHKLKAAEQRGDQPIIEQFEQEIAQLSKQLAQISHKDNYDLNKERKALLAMPHQRALTKEEQADQGRLKKSVKGLIIVHPLTKLGKSLELKTITGFSPNPF